MINTELQGNKQIASDLIDKYSFYSSFRTQWEERAIEWYKLFVGYKDSRPPGKSNLHIPRTFEIVDTLRARLVKAFFGQRPYIDFIPKPSLYGNPMEIDRSEEKAKIAAALVDDQLDKNDIPLKWYNYVTSLLVFPSGIMGVGWRHEEKPLKRRVFEPEMVQTFYGSILPTGRMFERIAEQMETVWDDNELVNIDFFDFWPDPKGYDLDSCRGVFTREWLTYERVIQLMQFLQRLNIGQVYLVDLDKLLETTSNLEDGRWTRMSAVGFSMEQKDTYAASKDQQDKMKSTFEVLHYWEDDRHSILINRAACIYDGPTPYWRHRKKPFITGSFDPLPGEFFGLSAVQLIADLQHELNSEHNQIMDNVNLLIDKMWKKLEGVDIDDDQLVTRPGGVIEVPSMDSLEPIEVGDIKASAFMMENIVNQQIENTLGTPPVVRGAEGQASTATEAMAKTTNAGTRFDVRILLLENWGVKRLATLMDLNNQQFITDSRLVKVSPADPVQWRMVEPYEIAGEYDYRPAGTSVDPTANKEVRRQQLTDMMTFLIKTGNPFINLFELTKAWIESFDIRNTQKFLISPEVLQMQQMQQMMMGGMGIPGMGAGPPVGTGPTNQPETAIQNQLKGAVTNG